MESHDHAQQLTLGFANRDLNEADTRHQLIDPLLHDVLGWPRARVRCEEYIAPGYADYVLTRADGTAILFIEAKREGKYFTLPDGLLGHRPTAYIKVRTLLTDDDTEAAVSQVREYCLNMGCEFGAITNGHQWIFFKTFQAAQDWRDLRAFVIARLDYFSGRFIEAHNNLSYAAIVEGGSLRRLLLDGSATHRQLFYPKDKIHSFDVLVDANAYASSLRPIVERYFGAIDVRDVRFMDSCYVSDREYDLALVNARRRLEDAITPFLEDYGVRDFRDGDEGGGFAKRVSKSLVGARPADVVVLFGGKGVGKSTFLKRLLFHKPPHLIQKNGIVAMIDLLDVPPDSELISQTIWSGIAQALDQDNVLEGNRTQLCTLFEDRFREATNQDLFGLAEESESYNIRLNDLVARWKKDLPYVTRCLAARLRSRHKAVIVNIDNTDQYDEELQELCFSIGKAVASNFPCVVIISMREERFYTSSIRGVLDAYQNSGFHITAPSPKEVFLRRIRYVRELLGASNEDQVQLPDRIDRDVVKAFFEVLQDNFVNKSLHLSNFLVACSHGNIRLALDLFRGFVVSGYTNVREMTAGGGWTLQIHQVIKPFMIPNRFFYSEALSKIPNIFQIRSKENGSHFTILRILRYLERGQESRSPPFISVAKVALQFAEIFSMKDDFRLNMDVLLKHHLVESNNRLDIFDENVDSVRITAYGLFMLNALSRDFTYLELAAEDCAIASAEVANNIAELSNDEYRFFVGYNAMERVQVRLKRADAFVAYLEREDERERHLYHPGSGDEFTRSIREAFDREKVSVLRSARKNIPKKKAFY